MRTILLLSALLVSGCSHYYGPVGRRDGDLLAKEIDGPHPDMGSTIVGLAASGGGSRAAYLLAAVLKEIRASGLRLDLPGESAADVDLVDQLDYISAVSGGGLSAAYFVVHKDELKGSVQTKAWSEYLAWTSADFRIRQWYLHGLLNPISWFKTLFTNFNRGVIARAHYDKTMFHGKTVAELPTRPSLALTATDIVENVRYVFANQNFERYGLAMGDDFMKDLFFDLLDPGSVKVADAVYATSAFPFAYPVFTLFHPPFSERYLADGGLLDNSGLSTLNAQIRREFDWRYVAPNGRSVYRRTPGRLVLEIAVDASKDKIGNWRTVGAKPDYAWKDTYFGQGRDSVSVAIANREEQLDGVRYREGLLTYGAFGLERGSLNPTDSPARHDWAELWQRGISTGTLLLHPVVIELKIGDVPHLADALPSTAPVLAKLYAQAGITAGGSELSSRILKIDTDFRIDQADLRVLDLAAYILVHAQLEPRLKEWQGRARKELEAAGVGKKP